MNVQKVFMVCTITHITQPLPRASASVQLSSLNDPLTTIFPLELNSSVRRNQHKFVSNAIRVSTLAGLEPGVTWCGVWHGVSDMNIGIIKQFGKCRQTVRLCEV